MTELSFVIEELTEAGAEAGLMCGCCRSESQLTAGLMCGCCRSESFVDES